MWYWNPATSAWTQTSSSKPEGTRPITAGDVTGDGKADISSCWNIGLWYQDGTTHSDGQKFMRMRPSKWLPGISGETERPISLPPKTAASNIKTEQPWNGQRSKTSRQTEWLSGM